MSSPTTSSPPQWLRTAALTVTGAVVLGGVLAGVGGDVWTWVKGTVAPGELVVAVVDESFEQVGGAYVVAGASQPSGMDHCELQLGAWAREQEGSIAVNNSYRVQVTNETANDVVLHKVKPVVVSSTPLPSDARQFVCPVGEPLPQRQASVRLGGTPSVDYSDESGNDLAGLLYRLEPGEQGVFYISHYAVPDVDEYVVRWQAELLYSESGSAESSLNVNEMSKVDDFVSAPLCAPAWLMTNPGVWSASGEGSCPAQ